MKKNNWKYWISWNFKMGFIGKMLLKNFKFMFPLSKEEILWKYPNLEEEQKGKIKKRIGNNVDVLFEYNKGEWKNDIYVYYIKNKEQKLFMKITPIPIKFKNRKLTEQELKILNKKFEGII